MSVRPATLVDGLRLDTRSTVETPEGIDLTLRAAGPAVRGLAWVIDAVIRYALLLFAAQLLALFGYLGLGLLLIVGFCLWWLYPIVFEVWGRGATLGKRAFGLCVVHDDGTPVGLYASVVRNLLRAVDMLPIGYALGLVFATMHPQFKRVGDVAAGTLVIYVDRPVGSSAAKVATRVPPPFPLTVEEQRAIIAFADRAEQLGSARADELAQIIAPLLDAKAQEARARVSGIAAWLRSR